jgi:hypothetical protein
MEKSRQNSKKYGLRRVNISGGTVFHTNVARLDHEKLIDPDPEYNIGNSLLLNKTLQLAVFWPHIFFPNDFV